MLVLCLSSLIANFQDFKNVPYDLVALANISFCELLIQGECVSIHFRELVPILEENSCKSIWQPKYCSGCNMLMAGVATKTSQHPHANLTSGICANFQQLTKGLFLWLCLYFLLGKEAQTESFVPILRGSLQQLYNLGKWSTSIKNKRGWP